MAVLTFEEAVDVLVRTVSLHDDWLRGAPQRVFLRRRDHLHQLPPERCDVIAQVEERSWLRLKLKLKLELRATGETDGRTDGSATRDPSRLSNILPVRVAGCNHDVRRYL